MRSEIDPYAAAEPLPGSPDLRVTLVSGRTVYVRCTVPVEGVLRLRTTAPPGTTGPRPVPPAAPREDDPSPILLPLSDRPARLTAGELGVEITGPGVRAWWQAGTVDDPEPGGAPQQGLTFGSFARFAEPEANAVPFRAGYLPATSTRPAGWVETVHLAPDAAVYGAGESYQGIDLRGRHRTLRNLEQNRNAGRDSAYLNIPLLWSDAGWGMFFHTGSAVWADLGATHSEAARVETAGDVLDMFLISGDAPTVLERYYALTGRPRPLPAWAYGVWMSRSSYFTAEEMTRTVDELEAAGCPVDVMHVDEWLEESVLRDASWSTGVDRSRFPRGWSRELSRRGVRTSLWINPYVLRGSPLADDLTRRGFLVRDARGRPVATADNPRTLIVDFTHPDARSWWGGRLADVLRTEDASAVLADFGEEIPAEAVFADGTTGSERHNSYGLLYHETVREAGVAARGEDFVAISRTGTAGSHRHPAHWAGDVPSAWSGLVSTLRALLSMSLSGCSAVTHDGGGFWTPASWAMAPGLREHMTPDAVIADVDPELYARWAQWAAFSPVMRFHGLGRREPTAYPEPARSAAVAACRLRRDLMGYLTACGDGRGPLMRPMPLALPGDRAARDATFQYLLGPDVLVAPVLEPGGRCTFYVPPGEWEPLVGCDPVRGPGWRSVRCDIDQFPAYARAGASVTGRQAALSV